MSQNEFDHLLESLGSMSPEQIQRLRRELDRRSTAPAESDDPTLTEAQRIDQKVQRSLFDAGLLLEIRPSKRVDTGTDDFVPIAIPGEPLSETIIRERR